MIIGIFLSLAGYSSGSVNVAKNRLVNPGLFDFVVVIFLWLSVILSRDIFGRWLAILVWICAGILVGAIVTLIRIRLNPQLGQTGRIEAESSKPKGLKQKWLQFIRNMGNYQTRVLLLFVYFIFLFPFGVGVRLFSDPLATRQSPSESGWGERSAQKASVDEAGRQF